MRKVLFILTGLIVLTGCVQTQKSSQNLPKELAGDWKAVESPWLITIDEKGQVVSAVHYMTEALIKPMQMTIVPFDQKKIAGEQVYNCGPWEVDYNPENRTMRLHILIDYKTQNSPAIIMGSIDEVLTGPINESFTEWKADWLSVNEFIVGDPISGNSIEKVTPDDKKFRGTLIFQKIEHQ